MNFKPNVMYYMIVTKKRLPQKILFGVNLLIAQTINLLNKRYKKIYNKTWIFGTGDDRYENNIRTFDQYLRKNGENVVWIVSRKNIKEDIWKDKKTVVQGSVKNYLLALNCYSCCFTHSDWDIAPGLFRIKKSHDSVLLYLEHAPSGMKRCPPDMHSKIPADIQCCLSAHERKLKLCEGAKERTAKVTGFAGYDDYSFRDRKTPIRSILIMPTWRDWDLNGDSTFYTTDLYKQYYDLFNDSRLSDVMQRSGVEVTFILHPTAARYFGVDKDKLFEKCSINVDVITGNDGKMREKIISSDMLITDYSTLCLDFLYMRKNVLFYWFDSQEYDEKHGLLVTKSELGNCIFENKDSIIDAIIKCIDDPEFFSIPPLASEYFDYYDHNNCSRIYREVQRVHDGR